MSEAVLISSFWEAFRGSQDQLLVVKRRGRESNGGRNGRVKERNGRKARKGRGMKEG